MRGIVAGLEVAMLFMVRTDTGSCLTSSTSCRKVPNTTITLAEMLHAAPKEIP